MNGTAVESLSPYASRTWRLSLVFLVYVGAFLLRPRTAAVTA